MALHIDLKKALVNMAHKAVRDALVKKDVSTQLLAVLCNMSQQSTITATLDEKKSTAHKSPSGRT